MSLIWLTVGFLAVWRLTHLLYAEDGPWELFARLRELAGDGLAGGLLDCFNCLSLWIAAPVAVVLSPLWSERLLLWPALSGAAILLQRLTAARAPEVLVEEEVRTNGMLRSTTTGLPATGTDLR